jgi:hypothetical protein
VAVREVPEDARREPKASPRLFRMPMKHPAQLQTEQV